jgi:hypothetical protein
MRKQNCNHRWSDWNYSSNGMSIKNNNNNKINLKSERTINKLINKYCEDCDG